MEQAIVRQGGINEVLRAYVAEQVQVRESSRNVYGRQLKGFFRWAETSGRAVADLTAPDVAAYVSAMLEGGLSPLTVAGTLTALRGFYAWTEANKHYPNIAKAVRSPKRTREFSKQALPVEKAKDLLTTAAAGPLRDYALLNLLTRCGLRCIEAARANVGDVQVKNGRFVLHVQGKGQDDRKAFVVLTDKVLDPIRAYLKDRGAVTDRDPLFASEGNRNGGGRLTTRTISRIAKGALKAVGLDDRAFTAHSLRHTTAVSILDAGGTLEDAQHVLRHSSITTTQVYTKSIEERRRLEHPAEALLDRMF